MRTGLLAVRDEDFPAQRGGAGGLLEGLERGEANDESAPHVGDTGAAGRLVAAHGVARERPARVRGRAQDPGAGGARRDRSRRDRRAAEDRLGRSVGDAAGKRRRGCVSEGRVGAERQPRTARRGETSARRKSRGRVGAWRARVAGSGVAPLPPREYSGEKSCRGGGGKNRRAQPDRTRQTEPLGGVCVHARRERPPSAARIRHPICGPTSASGSSANLTSGAGENRTAPNAALCPGPPDKTFPRVGGSAKSSVRAPVWLSLNFPLTPPMSRPLFAIPLWAR